MSNKLRRNKKKKREYNSWPAVIWFSLLELFTSVSTSGQEYGGDSSSFIEADHFLGDLGRKRKDKLLMVLGVLIGIFMIVLGIAIHQTMEVTILFAVLGAIIGIGSILLWLYLKKK